jgi:hypothetical protein
MSNFKLIHKDCGGEVGKIDYGLHYDLICQKCKKIVFKELTETKDESDKIQT